MTSQVDPVAESSNSPDASDPQLVAQINTMLDELASAGERLRDRKSFYDLALNRLLLATGSDAVTIWVRGPDQTLVPAYPLQLAQVYAGRRAAQELEKDRQVIADFLEAEQEFGVFNLASRRHVAAHRFDVLDKNFGAIALYRPSGEEPEVAKAFQRLVAAVVEILVDFERDFAVRSTQQLIEFQQQLVSLSLRMNESPTSTALAYVLANDGRPLVACDRLSVFRRFGLGWTHVTCSSVPRIDRRSRFSRRLTALTRRIAPRGNPLVFDSGASDLPPRLRQAVAQYTGEQHLSVLAMLPLKSRPGWSGRRRVIGAVVAEYVQPVDTKQALQRLDYLHQQASVPWSNRYQIERNPLRWLTAFAGAILGLLAIDRIPKTAMVLLAIGGLFAWLALTKSEFEIELEGQLNPVAQPHVWAPFDGIVREVRVSHGAPVRRGELLARLESPDLQLDIQKIQGQLDSAIARREGFSLSLKQAELANAEGRLDQLKLSSEIAQIETEIENLTDELAFLKNQVSKLTLTSPIDGQVLTWNVVELLQDRPVRQGESLIVIGDTAGPWQIEFMVPDRKLRYIGDAQSQLGDHLKIQCLLASDPEYPFSAQVQSVSPTASVQTAGQGPQIRLTAALDIHSVRHYRPGLSVVGRVQCGQKSLLYIWTYELVDAVRRRFFW